MGRGEKQLARRVTVTARRDRVVRILAGGQRRLSKRSPASLH